MAEVAGYRLIRRLGEGGSAEVWLGHKRGDAEVVAPDGLVRGGAEPGYSIARGDSVAIKLFRERVASGRIDAEIEALSRQRSRHVVRLLDLATDSEGRSALIVQRLHPGGLPRLISAQRTLRAGEAVTVLAPLASTLAESHAMGIVHGGVAASRVLFDESGAPVLTGWGGATLLCGREQTTTQAQRASDAGVHDDVTRLLAIFRAVLARVDPAEQHCFGELRGVLEQADAAPELRVALTELSETLFAAAEPLAIRRDVEPPLLREADATPSGPSRGSSARGESFSTLSPGGANSLRPTPKQRLQPSDPAPARGAVAAPLWLAALGLPDWLCTIIVTAGGSLGRGLLLRRVARAATTIRRRFWVLSGAVLAIIIAFALALPAIESGARGGTEAETGTSAGAGNAPGPSASGLGAEADLPPVKIERSALTADDPVAAAVALIRLREGCFTQLSILCLDGVDQPNSAMWDADSYAIRRIQNGEEASAAVGPAPDTVTLLDRMGDTALLSARSNTSVEGESTTASVLIIRTEAGWRIRDVLGS